MLVVVKDRDVAAGLQLFLNLEAAGGGNILQIDSAEGASQQSDGVDDLIHVLAADAEWNGVHAAEGLKQDALALHHRHAGLGTDVAQPQDGAAVRHDGHGVPAAGQFIALCRVLLNLQAGLGHAGRIGQGQRLPGVDGHAGSDLQLAVPGAVRLQRGLCVIHKRGSFPKQIQKLMVNLL